MDRLGQAMHSWENPNRNHRVRVWLSFAAFDNLLDRFETEVDQRHLSARDSAQPPLDRFAHLTRFLDFLAITIERFDDLRIFRARRNVQTGEVIRFYCPALRVILRDP